MVVPIYKKGYKFLCENHEGFSLVSVTLKPLAGIIVYRLSNTREKCIRETQAGFRPGRGCVDQLFILRQILEHGHVFRRSKISVFLELKETFDSVDGTIWWRCLSLNSFHLTVPYADSRNWVYAYGDVSLEFTTKSSVPHCCFVSLFSVLWLRLFWKQSYPYMRIVTLIFVQTSNSLT